ncbi:MAG: DTW domain-containing protein [Candidatus Delongbacteria bacterium]|nr:DTW domain-containing protein [Candidatus Delongbacteria bacterium]
MLFKSICICSKIKKFDLRTKITLLMHIREINKTTNTGKLAKLMLNNCGIAILGRKDIELQPEELIFKDHTNLILFPAASNELNEKFLSTLEKPINLIVLDGNYHQAVKMTRSELLRDIKRVRLPYGQKSSYELRTARDSEKISTIEAIIKAIEIIENGPVVKEMEKIFLKMIDDIKTKMGSC